MHIGEEETVSWQNDTYIQNGMHKHINIQIHMHVYLCKECTHTTHIQTYIFMHTHIHNKDF